MGAATLTDDVDAGGTLTVADLGASALGCVDAVLVGGGVTGEGFGLLPPNDVSPSSRKKYRHTA